jgi:predicted nucleic acid-binding protein
MAAAFLVDTDVLVDYLRDQPGAVAWLENLAQAPLISAITVAELYAGVRDGQERSTLDTFISACGIVPVDEEAAVLGGLYRRNYGKSHNGRARRCTYRRFRGNSPGESCDAKCKALSHAR